MDALQKLLFVDILQFSGLAMICFAGIKKRNMGPGGIAGIALLIMALNALLAYGFGLVTFDFAYALVILVMWISDTMALKKRMTHEI